MHCRELDQIKTTTFVLNTGRGRQWKSGDHTTTWHPQYIGSGSDARKLTVELHQNLENVLQQSVQQSIQHAQDHSKDCVSAADVLPTTRRIL